MLGVLLVWRWGTPPHPVLPADGCLVGPEPLGEPGPGPSPSHVLLGSSVFTAVPSVGSPVQMGKLRHGAVHLLPGNPAGRPWAEVSTPAVPAESSLLLADRAPLQCAPPDTLALFQHAMLHYPWWSAFSPTPYPAFSSDSQ